MRIVALQARQRAAILVDTSVVDTSVVDTSVVMRSGGQVVLLVTTKTDYSGILQQELGINGSVMMVAEGAGVYRDRAVKVRWLAHQFPVARQAQTLFRRALGLAVLEVMARAAAVLAIGRVRIVNRPSPGGCFGILTGWATDRMRFHRVSDGRLGAGFGNAVEEEGQDTVPDARRAG
jgi:hypothetical protein